MTAILADISFGPAPLVIKAILGLMTLVGCTLFAFVAILAAVKNRPGIAAFVAGLMVLLLLLPAGLVLTYVNTRHSRPFEFVHPSMTMEGPTMWVESQPAIHSSWSSLSLLLILGVVFAVFAGMFRRSTANGEKRKCGSWWPVPFFVVLPLLFFLYFGALRGQRSEIIRERVEHHPRVMIHDFSVQQNEMARRARALEAELHRQIAELDIHELMDRFDAPRIVLATPPSLPVTLFIDFAEQATAWLSPAKDKRERDNASLAIAGSAVVGVRSETPPVERVDDAQLDAEADAAVKIIAAEADWAESSSDAETNLATAESVESFEAPTNEPAEVTPQSDRVPAAREIAEVHGDEADVVAELSTPIAVDVPERDSSQPRPEWVDRPPQRFGEVRRESFVTEEWPAEDISRARDIGLMLKVYEYVQRLNGAPRRDYRMDAGMVHDEFWQDHRLHQLQQAGITLDFIETEIAKDEYVETVERSVGPMMKSFTLLEFNPAVDRQLRRYWDAYQRQESFAVVGVGAGGILALLGLCYGLLKVDTWTKGYYTKRLFLGVPAAIIGLGALLAWFVERN